MSIFSKLANYLRDSIAELKKVTWPTKKQTTEYTLLVIGISLALALFIGVVDYILALGVEKIIK
ncbi:MAG: preprotein translocase subunit SecE [Candidatus Buchananbacteria bacterium RBG_13_39_9]|jgi:preprotein translocase subunit SecE|uniref:Protein translocase subunit SecE n=1 Tax=Candidatus Buchananbacteria bacterium RBG_13_39_9 TaxID=1797531 RepID=A0A1G1XQ03_9BACT|nr:MAG: preprotein translocase subunit SecE [Candidatus Buchananbacteria bacterium RBG_13_39_9]